ncbi:MULTISPECIES: hypothetical protein [Haloferax]|uniref:DUF2892 domain-containing protein n=1 Tax=Haloferax marinum TaxID=2666143 RepID=A0A6A8G8Z8_9EURY|nr:MULTISPECIES: hypothetical protein [Haloferax]KAB1197699.1 hypothetical protein Hfx1150_09260 [Haloferax sp. CBA1150]MRW96753.1 hypothetical protein [Haloferax marinum]
MIREKTIKIIELFVRLFGAGLVVVGVLSFDWSPLFGVLFVGGGLLFAFRPSLAVDLLDFVAT